MVASLCMCPLYANAYHTITQQTVPYSITAYGWLHLCTGINKIEILALYVCVHTITYGWAISKGHILHVFRELNVWF